MGNKTSDGILTRNDKSFREFLQRVKIKRVINGLEKKTISDREVTRMIPNTDVMSQLEKELTSKPRKLI
jgi:hypothetical protein